MTRRVRCRRKNPIFISYARDDSEFALRLGKDLRSAGANIWLDQLDIVSGQRWDDSVEQALETCKSFLVILSPTATTSENVKDELSFALEEKKQVIPVLYQSCKIPFRIRRIQHSDFTRDYNKGFNQLLKALNIEPVEAELIDKSQIQTQPKPKKKKVTAAVTAGTIQTSQIQLRSQPLDNLAEADVEKMLKQRDFFDLEWNESGKGLEHQYEETEQGGEKLVIDHTTGLTWQQSGSDGQGSFEEAQEYIQGLNDRNFAGYE